jgi:hypothetical protein
MRGFSFANWRKTASPVPEMVEDKSLEDTPEAIPLPLRLMKEVAEMSSSACEDSVLPPPPAAGFTCNCCGMKYALQTSLTKHYRSAPSHKPASTSTASEILPPRTSGRKSKKPRILQPTENLRDHTVGYKNWAQTGKREFHKACVERDKSTVESMTAQKKCFIKMGILSMDEYIFDAKVQARLNEELPLFLKDLRPLEGSSKYISTGTDSYGPTVS